MHITELSTALSLSPEEINDLCRVLADDKAVYAALQHRINIRHASGRDCDEAGVHAVDPEPIAVRLKIDILATDEKSGDVVTKPYREALDLINNGIAVIPE